MHYDAGDLLVDVLRLAVHGYSCDAGQVDHGEIRHAFLSDDEGKWGVRDALAGAGNLRRRGLARSAGNFATTDISVVSWNRLPLYEVAFGWGPLEFIGPASLICPRQFLILSSPDGGVKVCCSVETEKMDSFVKLFHKLLPVSAVVVNDSELAEVTRVGGVEMTSGVAGVEMMTGAGDVELLDHDDSGVVIDKKKKKKEEEEEEVEKEEEEEGEEKKEERNLDTCMQIIRVLGKGRKSRTRFQSLISIDDCFEETKRNIDICSAVFDDK
ncbi:hypothetical protein KFK09_009008 [Dendrobium nobile]|uniref:Uncharacterized protein n=1 Tax=Dendrobium nobile TaxID=94219 RepID=A0A8T3BR75_DENNO|nr:hypothetical protein KFK09_009008 [Dendrobium nobile]